MGLGSMTDCSEWKKSVEACQISPRILVTGWPSLMSTGTWAMGMLIAILSSGKSCNAKEEFDTHFLSSILDWRWRAMSCRMIWQASSGVSAEYYIVDQHRPVDSVVSKRELCSTLTGSFMTKFAMTGEPTLPKTWFKNRKVRGNSPAWWAQMKQWKRRSCSSNLILKNMLLMSPVKATGFKCIHARMDWRLAIRLGAGAKISLIFLPLYLAAPSMTTMILVVILPLRIMGWWHQY